MSRRRRGGPEGLTIIYWRDIPAQITATVDGATAKTMLEPRFQHAIDRAAAVADLTETEAYIAQWRRDHEPADGLSDQLASAGGLDALVEARATDLDQRYPRERLEQLVAQGGADAGANGQETGGKASGGKASGDTTTGHITGPDTEDDHEDEESDR